MEKPPQHIERLTEEVRGLKTYLAENFITRAQFKEHTGEDNDNFGDIKSEIKEVIQNLYKYNKELVNQGFLKDEEIKNGHEKILEKLEDLNEKIDPLTGLSNFFKGVGLIQEPASKVSIFIKAVWPAVLVVLALTGIGWLIINKAWSWLVIFLPNKI
jgi:hypothetical protein